MAMNEFFGCLLTTFGIPIVLFIYGVLFHPLRMITFVTSATFWLISLLFSAVIWAAVVPLKDKLAFSLVFSVIFQELVRFSFIFMLLKFDKGLKSLVVSKESVPENESNEINNTHDQIENTGSPLIEDILYGNNSIKKALFDVKTFSYVGGLGFGLMSGLYSTMDLLRGISGPGTLGMNGQPYNFTTLYSLQALLVILNHVAYTVIMSCSYQHPSPMVRYIKLAVILLSHLLISCLTLLNQMSNASISLAVLVVNALISLAIYIWCLWEAQFNLTRVGLVSKQCAQYHWSLITCKDKDQ